MRQTPSRLTSLSLYLSFFLLAALCLTARAAAAQELVFLRDGGRRSGQLQSCVADQCRLSGQTIARADIVWIRFHAQGEMPPAGADPAHDTVFSTDGTRGVGRVVGISLGEVALEQEAVPRPQVAWVRFAGPLAGFEAAPPPPPPPPPPDGTGALWTGTITGRYWGTVDGVTTQMDVSAQARLREVKRSPLMLVERARARAVGTIVQLEPAGTVVTVSFRSSGQYLSCSGGGTATATSTADDPRFGHPSVIYSKTEDVDTTPALGFDVARAPSGLYQVGVNVPNDVQFTYTCISGGVSSEVQSGYVVPMLGKTPLLPPGPHVDPELRYLQDGGNRMQGSYTASSTGAFEQLEAVWDLTRSERRP